MNPKGLQRRNSYIERLPSKAVMFFDEVHSGQLPEAESRMESESGGETCCLGTVHNSFDLEENGSTEPLGGGRNVEPVACCLAILSSLSPQD